MRPEVLYVILCDDVQPSAGSLLRSDIRGLTLRLRSTASPPFPFTFPKLCILVMLTNCQGQGEIYLRVRDANTDKIIFRNPSRHVRFAGTPDEIVGFVFRINRLRFPAPGRYHVDVVFANQIIGGQAFFVSPPQS